MGQRKKYDLVGIDGNAFFVIGYVTHAMRKNRKAMGWNTAHECGEAVRAYMADAKSSDYNHLIAVSAEMVERINRAI